MPQFQPFNYGQTIGQAENILASQYGRDPNSLRNQLLRAQMERVNRDAGVASQFGGIDPTAQMKNDLYREQLIKNGATPDDLARFDNSVARAWYGKIGGVQNRAVGAGTPEALGTLDQEMQGAGSIANATEAGKQFAAAGQSYPTAPVQATELNLGVGQPQAPQVATPMAPPIQAPILPPSASALAASKEEAVSTVKNKWAGVITQTIKLAEAEAKERGEVLTDRDRLKATLPGLTASVEQLKKLGKIATYTEKGKFWDATVRQSGFGATKGATARADFIAIVDNQVLPLLRQTFGAAFTVKEGEWLRATMGNPDFSPEEKDAQLDAFIAQKVRNIEAKDLQLGNQPAQDNAVNWSDL